MAIANGKGNVYANCLNSLVIIMATRRVSRLPYDPVVPSQPVVVQCRIGPGTFFKTPQKSDFIAPPNTLVFCKATETVARTGIQKGRPVNVKRKREGEVHDVICNMQDIGSRDLQCELRALGVTWDGVFDATGAQRYPDQIGRLSVIVGGAVTIHINRKELDMLGVGDMLAWELQDNGLVVEGLPRTFSSVKIVKAGRPLPGGNVDSMEMSLGNWFPDRIQAVPGKKDDITNRMLALASFFQMSQGDLSFGGVSPYAIARNAAIVFMRKLGIPGTDWENMFYNPHSDRYIMSPKPADHGSIEWLEHAFGVNTSDTYETQIGGKDNAFKVFSAAKGWFNSDPDTWTTADEKKEIKRIADMAVLPTSAYSNDYFLFKAVHDLAFTHEDAIKLTNPIVDPKDVGQLATFLKPMLDGGITHLRLRWKAFALTVKAGKPNDTAFAGTITPELPEPQQNSNDTDLEIDNNFVLLRMLTAINVDLEGYDDSVVSFVDDGTNLGTGGTAVADVTYSSVRLPFYTYMKEMFDRRLSVGTRGTGASSRVFGMLLEKSTGSDEARVLLCPGAAAV